MALTPPVITGYLLRNPTLKHLGSYDRRELPSTLCNHCGDSSNGMRRNKALSRNRILNIALHWRGLRTSPIQ
jgi:hypothetical protein